MKSTIWIFILMFSLSGCGGFQPLPFEKLASGNGDLEDIVDDPELPPPVLPVARVPLGTFSIDATKTSLSQTGLFKDVPNLIPADGVIEYNVTVALFSDDAKKRRWMVVPSDAQITFSPSAAWTFPTGTILVKHFEIQNSATTFQKLETRLLVRGAAAWTSYLYIWNAARNDATLQTTNTTAPITYFNPATGLTENRTWTFPAADCTRCHVGASGVILGVNARQLNIDIGTPIAPKNQLAALNMENFFTADIGAPAALPIYPKIDDVTQPIESRAKAYLAVNCAHCHQPGGPAAFLDFRYVTPLAGMNIVAVVGNAGLPRLTLGSKENSLLWNRLNTTVAGIRTGRMPPVGRAVIHGQAVDVVGTWIDGL